MINPAGSNGLSPMSVGRQRRQQIALVVSGLTFESREYRFL